MASLLFLIPNSVILSDISPSFELVFLRIPISITGDLSFAESFLSKDDIVWDMMELVSSLSLIPRSLLLSSSNSPISDPDDLSPEKTWLRKIS